MGASLFTANRGVSALGASLARLVWTVESQAEVSLMIGNRDARPAPLVVDGVDREVHTVNYRLSPRAPLHQQLWAILVLSLLYRIAPSAIRRWLVASNVWLRTAAEADLVGDIRGGDSFSDIYGLGEFLLGCLPVLSILWVRGTIDMLPQTYGPFRSRVAKVVARHILMRAGAIWCRDRVSLAEIAELTGGRRAGQRCPDVAFLLEARRPESPAIDPPFPAAQGDTVVGLNVSGLMYHGGFTRANMFGLRLDYPAFLTRLVGELLSEPGTRVLLVPHTFAPPGRVESDPDACRALHRHLPEEWRGRVHLVTEAYDQHGIKGVIGMCDFFIGSRMHACIAALSQGIPTVGVAYSRKFAGVFETIGVEDWVVDGRAMTTEEALGKAMTLFRERAGNGQALIDRVASAHEELRAAFELLLSRSGKESRSRWGHAGAL